MQNKFKTEQFISFNLKTISQQSDKKTHQRKNPNLMENLGGCRKRVTTGKINIQYIVGNVCSE
jgi:hypothetical protein